MKDLYRKPEVEFINYSGNESVHTGDEGSIPPVLGPEELNIFGG